ncbi:MAG: chondroitinase family polysaccharide lyase [Bacteroides sp.]
MKSIRLIFSSVLLLIGTSGLSAQQKNNVELIGFEDTEIPSIVKAREGSSLSLVSNRYKEGKQSLRWSWQKGAKIIFESTQQMNKAVSFYRNGMQGSMRFWIYNEKPSAIPLQIAFNDEKGTAQYYFPFNLNFTGWRACWIRFDQMYGDKKTKKVSDMTILAPRRGEGVLYLDRMSFIANADNRITPDAQIPFVSGATHIKRWLGLWPRYTEWTYDMAAPIEITDAQKKEYALIYDRVVKNVCGGKLSDTWVEGAKKRFYDLGIQKTTDGWKGMPVVTNFEVGEGDMQFSKYANVMLAVARSWYWTQDKEFAEMYLTLLNYFIDQGFDIGSSMGSMDLYGYQFRDIAPSMCLMRPVLEATGNLPYYAELMGYWSDMQNHRKLPQDSRMEGYCDMWLTQLASKIYTIALMPDTPKKVLESWLLQRWVNNSVLPTLGTFSGMKPDGTVFHHWGNYPGYSAGGLEGIGTYLKITKNTIWQPSTEALSCIGKALDAFLWFVNGDMFNDNKEIGWAWAVSGRSPLSSKINPGLIEVMCNLGEIGDPHSSSPIWKNFAEQYMRLTSKGNAATLKFNAAGLLPGKSPEGFRTYNYAAMGIQRRNDWLAVMKGYNKHVWCTESYSSQNRFGRYLSYGTLQIIPKGAPNAKYYINDGWDWNRFSGATIVYLPLDKLVNPSKSTLAVLSDEVFAGASCLNGMNGIFGQKLHEDDKPTFTPSHRARKSMFAFDDLIVCIGTGIENTNKDYHTETVLWQQALPKKEFIKVEGKDIKKFPSDGGNINKAATWLTDPMGNNYYIPAGQEVIYKNSLQKSRNHEDKKDTEGDYSIAYLNHGFAPQGASYHYCVQVQPDKEKTKMFETVVSTGKTPYTVLQQDNNAHIVTCPSLKLTDYVVFEPQNFRDKGILLSASESLIMVKENAESLSMSVCHPHLNLEKLPDDDSNERVYNGASRPMPVTVTIAGEWKLKTLDKRVEVISVIDGKTQMRISGIDGIPVEMELINAH